jgi:hypothetical protein
LADKNNIIFKSGPIANINTTDIIAGQLLFAIEDNAGSIYFDKDGTNRIKLNADALKLVNARTINGTSFDGTSDITTTKWGTARNIIISDNSGTYTQTNSGIDGSSNFTLKLPANITATLKGNADSATYATSAGSADTAKACTGNAATASKLKAGAEINGTAFDGSAAITTTKWGTARNVSIGNSDGTGTGTAVSVDGSGAVTLLLPATIVAALKGNADTATKATTADSATTATTCTGNAATASKLKTGVFINGTTFDGSAAITTTNWGTARTVTISDNAGDHTQANTGINGSANFTLKLPDTITATLVGNASSATYATNAGTADTAKACTGNAATASKLKTGVEINGTTFDGSAAITTTKWGTARNISIGNSDGTGAGTAVSVDGSGAITLKLPTEIKANVTSAGKLSGDSSDVGDANTPVYFEDGIPKPITSIDVKSDKAGKLDPGASINGTLFTGESNITTNTWGTARSVTIKDASKTNTGEAVSVNGSEAFSLLLPATIKATLDGNAATATRAASADSATTAASCTGNAATASKLKTGVAINGTDFDGSSAITTTNWGTARTVTISDNSGTYTQANTDINGSANFTLKLPATLAASITGNAATATKATSADSATTATTCTGNAGTATALKNARNINGTSFDGTSDITTANWGTARTVTISDNDGTNTQANTGINGSANFTLKLPATIKANLTGKATSAGTADTATTATTATTTTGNAGSATKLKTARSINGTDFDGSSDITTANWGTARDISIVSSDGSGAGATVSVNGSGNVSLKLPATIKANLTGKATSAGTADNATTATTATTCTGNAATATILQTARTINGTSFDGSGNITTANWGTARNFTIKDADSTNAGTPISVNGSGSVTLLLPATIKANITGKATSAGTADSATKATTATTCTGNAATATKLETPRAINGTNFDGSAAITTTKWGTTRTLSISSTAGTTGTGIDGSADKSLVIPSTMTGFSSITSTKLIATSIASDTGHIVFPDGGQYTTSSSTKTGYLKITLPVSWTNAMMRFYVDIYNYSAGTSATYIIGGYNYSNDSAWKNAYAQAIGAPGSKLGNLNVYFGHDGSKCAIYIGAANTSWDYPQVMIRDLYVGYTQDEKNYATDWSIDFTTTLGTITQTVENTNVAYKLYTARTINGTNFDGSANITTTNWGTARTLKIGNTGKSVNGSSNVTWTIAEIGAVNKAGDSMSGALTLNTSIQDHESPTGQCLVINCAAPASDVTVTDKNSPGIGFHIGQKTWGSLIIHPSGFKFINSSSNGYMPVYASAFHGNATSATKLETARTINGTDFDGSANITTASWGTARNISIGSSDGTNVGTAVSVDGSGAVTLKLPTVIKATVSAADKLTVNAGDANTPVYFENGVPKEVTSIDVKSDKAGKLDPGRNINGTLFTGESDITTAKWGTARNIYIYSSDGTGAGAAVSVDGSDTINLKLPSTIKATLSGNASSATTAAACSGNAATATKLAKSVAINGTSFDGSAGITTEHWGKERTIYIASNAGTSGTAVNGSSNVSLVAPSTMTGFESITSTKFVAGGKVTLQYNTTNECLEFVFA